MNPRLNNRSRVFDEKKLFSFIHISKSGGSTFIKWARASRIFLHFYPHINVNCNTENICF